MGHYWSRNKRLWQSFYPVTSNTATHKVHAPTGRVTFQVRLPAFLRKQLDRTSVADGMSEGKKICHTRRIASPSARKGFTAVNCSEKPSLFPPPHFLGMQSNIQGGLTAVLLLLKLGSYS